MPYHVSIRLLQLEEGLMAGFWNKKTPTVSLILVGIVDASLFIAVSDNSRFGYWPAIILLVAILLSVLNNLRIDRLEARRMTRGQEGDAKAQ
jgi:hypothetical protein